LEYRVNPNCLFGAKHKFANHKSNREWQQLDKRKACYCLREHNITPENRLAGAPAFTSLIQGNISIPLSSTQQYWVSTSDIEEQQLSVYDWNVTLNLEMVSSHYYQQDVYVEGLTLGRGSVYFLATNGCGATQSSLPVRVTDMLLLSVYPNPASDYVELSFVPVSGETDKAGIVIPSGEPGTDGPGEYEVQVWSEKASLVKTEKSDKGNLHISTSDLKEGTYFLHLIMGGQTYRKQLIVER